MTGPVSYEVRDGVALLLVDSPPVNAIDVAIRKGLKEGIARAQTDAAAKVILITCAGRTFMSGADLNELGGTIAEPGFYDTLNDIEASAKPVAAALFGTALGGGLETAMACHYRAAVADGRMGMPEITLGILPGAGGTQRLPRLIGARPALEMIVSGAPIDAARAKELGLIDTILDGSPVEAGLAWARTLIGQPVRRTGDKAVDTAGFSDADIDAYLKSQARALNGRTTQHLVVESLKAAAAQPLAEGLKTEDRLSQASLKSREGQALIHLFFAEREVGKIPGLAPTPALAINKAAVVGAGTMGGGIAMSLVNSGVPTTLIDVSQEALDRGLKVVRDNYAVTVQRGRMTEAELEERMAMITPAIGLSGAAQADVVIEAVFEDMDLKKRIIRELDQVTPAHTILASNTSTLSITELAAETGRADKVVGLHFFSPAHVMRLLEIVRGDKISNETLVTSLEIARKLRKVGVVSGDAFGFIGNRMMQEGYFREAEQLLLEGASAEQIDRVIEGFGFAMGPNKVNDMAGVDVGYKVREELFKKQTRPDPYFAVSDALAEQGKFGQKTGEGVYLYKPGDRTPYRNEATEALIEKLAAERQIKRREISDAEVLERCILPLINVGAELLSEGVAYRALDCDIVWTAGYGFPRHLGGPMFHGDTLGLKHVLERVRYYEGKLGHYWKPAPLLIELAEAGSSFEAWDKSRK
ncbi:MAG: 3-hydroxyacyl-CoA dehydrogenase NAD-binding domain-containing protein [Caulobacteraceae bacterium]